MRRYLLQWLLLLLIITLPVTAWDYSFSSQSASSRSGAKNQVTRSALARGEADASSDVVIATFLDFLGLTATVPERGGRGSLEQIGQDLIAAGVDGATERVALEALDPAMLPALTVTADSRLVLIVARDAKRRQSYIFESRRGQRWLPDLDWERTFSGEVFHGTSRAAKPARMWIPGGWIDVGNVPNTKPRELLFAFRNTSSEQPIKILKVASSCGCTRVMKFTESVRPDNFGMFTLVVDPARSASKTELSQNVYFEIDLAGVRQKVDVRVVGRLVPELVLTPQNTHLNAMQVESSQVLDVFVYAPDPREVKVTPVYCDAGLALLEDTLDAARGRRRLRWRFDPGRVKVDEYGRFVLNAVVRCDFPDVDGIATRVDRRISFHGRLPVQLDIYPRELFFGQVEPKSVWRGRLQLAAKPGSVRIFPADDGHVKVDLHDDFLQVSLTAPDNECIYRTNIVVSVDGKTANVGLTGFVVNTPAHVDSQ